VPGWKLFGPPDSANGSPGRTYGLPRFANAEFAARFPFATLTLADPDVPVRVKLTGWSPFEAGDADHASLPVAALEYELTYTGPAAVDAVLAFNARNFMAIQPPGSVEQGGVKVPTGQRVRSVPGGLVFEELSMPDGPLDIGAFCVRTPAPGAKVNAAWFRGGWFDALTMAWRDAEQGVCSEKPAPTAGGPTPGATLAIPLRLVPGTPQKVVLELSWYVPHSDQRYGGPPPNLPPTSVPADPAAALDATAYRPWYAARFDGVDAVAVYWHDHYDTLRTASQRFSDCFFDTTLPAEAIEAAAANLSILKSPTVFRQADGRLWGWEGCCDGTGCCAGSCTHVWNYAQALPHLMPALERTLRQSEFEVSQDDRGHQEFRTRLPIAPIAHTAHAAADGQLGGIVKVYREWRISGDTDWLRRLWPRVRASLDYGIKTWDIDRSGAVTAPHHNTYDIEFWGPDPLCTSFYLAALTAAVQMGTALGEDVAEYATLRDNSKAYIERELWNGEYFNQKDAWRALMAHEEYRRGSQIDQYSPEARALLEAEGPKYQYGSGCLSDGVLGAWLAAVSGLGDVLDREKLAGHLRSVHRYNLRQHFRDHANPQRPTYACGDEGGLLLCTWPRGGKPALPFIYSDEVWTGIEYQVASHLILLGRVEEGLEVVRLCRARYDGRVRDPFDEYECGHWYARAMSSYALLPALSGARYDAVERVLYLRPAVHGDFRAFLSTATGYGTVGVRGAKPFVDVVHGTIPYERIAYTPAS
jgi:hypothetical protein